MSLSVVSFGAGRNSTALLVGLHERNERPDAILFADTGGEKPETYKHLAVMRAWCKTVGFPKIITVRRVSRHESLEAECHNNQTLPSLAFGFRGCSNKWKARPLDKWVRQWPLAIAEWEAGRSVRRFLGIHAGEQHRGLITDSTGKFLFQRPLVDWDWAEEECEAAISRAGLPVPTKSACFFCPAMKKHEVIQLAEQRPRMFDRAVAMERQAMPNLDKVKGLGRNWSWENLVAADREQLSLFQESPDMPCICDD